MAEWLKSFGMGVLFLLVLPFLCVAVMLYMPFKLVADLGQEVWLWLR